MNNYLEYFIALVISTGLSFLIGIFLNEKKILHRLDKAYFVALFAIFYTYLLHGIMYIEDQIFSIINKKEPSFDGCSGVFNIPAGLEKCFYLIPKTEVEFGLMVGKLLSSNC